VDEDPKGKEMERALVSGGFGVFVPFDSLIISGLLRSSGLKTSDIPPL
ncbi:hypothetical protein A2U01_0076415, partial [Trifolium medium]|nr:hypothetical protein [Trifolium medium]